MSKATFNEVLWLLAEKEGMINMWKEKGFLISTKNEYVWSKEALREVGYEKSGNLVTLDWIPEYIEKFDKDNIGIIGKKAPENVVLERMRRFVREYNYEKKTILAAVDAYIRHLKKEGSIQFIRRAHYFIYKKEEKGTENCDLAVWCDIVLREGAEQTKDYSKDL